MVLINLDQPLVRRIARNFSRVLENLTNLLAHERILADLRCDE